VKLAIILGGGLFVAIFLWLYQPFGASEIKENQYLFLSGFGVCVSLGLAVGYLVFPKLIPALFEQEKWQIKKEILFLLAAFLIISVLNYLYNSTVGLGIAPQHSLIAFVGITVSIGIFPVIVLIFLVEVYMSKRNSSSAEILSQALPHKDADEDEEFTIVPETVRSQPLTVRIDDFLFVKSDNNYTTFFFKKEDQVQKALLRASLKNVEKQLVGYEDIIRCHNSYMINKNKIESIKGNARSLYLILEDYDEDIPISRGFDKEKLLS
jgi:hypothetical protein